MNSGTEGALSLARETARNLLDLTRENRKLREQVVELRRQLELARSFPERVGEERS